MTVTPDLLDSAAKAATAIVGLLRLAYDVYKDRLAKVKTDHIGADHGPLPPRPHSPGWSDPGDCPQMTAPTPGVC